MLLLVAYWSSCFHNNHNFGKCFLPSALGLWLLFKMESQNNLITGTNYTDDLFLNEGVCVFVCSIPSDSACVNFFFFYQGNRHVRENDKRQTDVWWHPTTLKAEVAAAAVVTNVFVISGKLTLISPPTSHSLLHRVFLRGIISVAWNHASVLGCALVGAPLSGSPLWCKSLPHSWEQRLTEQ